MAKKKESRFKNLKIVNSALKTIDSSMKDIYKSTYHTSKDSLNTINQITQDLEDNISNIISKNNMSDISAVSKIYARMKIKDTGDPRLVSAVENLFDDQALMPNILSMYTESRWIKDLDHEYDTILKLMPKLQEALNAKKENVLSSDNFSKEFLNSSTNNITNPNEQSIFTTNIEILKYKYKLQQFYEDVYDNIAKYGEEFVYCVPYTKAISDLLKRKGNTKIGRSFSAHTKISESGVHEICVIENGVISDVKLYEQVDIIAKDKKMKLPDNFKIIFDNRGFLESAYEEQLNIHSKLNSLPKSIYECVTEAGKVDKVKLDNSIPDELELPKNFDKTSTDGFISLTDSNRNTNIKAPGCVLKTLKHENVIPIYIDQTCLGYYYIEFLAGSSYDVMTHNDRIYSRSSIGFTGQPEGRSTVSDALEDQRNQLLAYFAGNIAQHIDAEFVNNNQDIAKQIYDILKFNDLFNSNSIENIRISFLPEEDVEHIFFRQNPITHRGISDLEYALIPGKLYACLYITNTLGILTRGQDKRVYYVKQNVEQNIAQTMLNVINQIKRGNFGMREIENMNTILNLTGRFNDYVIPVGPSGDAPVQFEVMQGQEFNPYTDLMDRLEEMAINSTDMPIEFIQNRMQSLDFAVQATTVNAKVLRSTYKRQSIFEYYISRIQTKLYNYEFNENITISCSLPAPLFLHMTNINQLIENTKMSIQAIADYEYEAETAVNQNADAIKAIFIRNMMRKKLTTYLKLNEIDEMKKEAEMEFNKNKNKEE